jgi:O-antigen ligase
VTTHATLSDAFLLGAGVLLLVALVVGSFVPTRPPRWFTVSGLTLVAGAVISSVLSTAAAASLAVAVEYAVAAFIAPLIIGEASKPARWLVRFADLWLVSAGLNCVVALLDFLGVTAVGRSLLGREFLHRVSGLTVHPNHLGIVAGMALPVAVAQMASTSSRLRRIFYGLLSASMALGVLVSGSRSAFAGTVAGLLFLFIIAVRARSRIMLYVYGGGLIGVALVSLAVALATHNGFITLQRLAGVDTGQTAETRFSSYRDALAGFASSPIVGHGFQLIVQTHDIYLQLLQAGGLLALGAFAAYVVGTLRLAWQLGHNPLVPAPSRLLIAGLSASILVWLINGLAENQLYDRYLYVPIGLLLGLSFVFSGPSATRTGPERGRPTFGEP